MHPLPSAPRRGHPHDYAALAIKPPTPLPPPESDKPSDSENSDSPPIPSLPCQRPPPPPQPPPPCHQQPRMDYDPDLVGHSLEHSLKVLGLGLVASEMEVKVQYCALVRIYHPDKHDPARTGMIHKAAADFFKKINNANSYLQEIL